jgi:tRNA C32,U32 (ribose-2'-O)-methylase TrmJ
MSKGDARETAPLAASARKDLGAVTNDDLRKLADVLAARPSSAEAAKRAVAALDRGDRAAAADALREALGGAPSVAGADGTGTAAASRDAGPAARAPWAAATWPLRYDRVVRRWLDETAATEASKK